MSWFARLASAQSAGLRPPEGAAATDEPEEESSRDAEPAEASEEIRKTLEGLATLRSSLFDAVEDELRELCASIVSRMLTCELESRPEQHALMVRELIAERFPGAPVEVRCSASRQVELDALLSEGGADLRVVVDRELGPWDFELVTAKSRLDGRVDSRLAELENFLRERPLSLDAREQD